MNKLVLTLKSSMRSKFLVEGAKVLVRKYKNEVLDIELKPKVELIVTTAYDAVKGNTSSNPSKSDC